MASLSTVGVPEVAPDARAPDAFQSTSVTAGSFGGATAAAAEGFGQAVLKTADFFGEVVVDDQANQLFDKWNKRLRGDPNQQVPGPDGQMTQDTGYMGLKGRNALDARPGFEKSLDEDLKEIRKNIVTPKQQAKFDDQTRRYRQHVLGLAGSHADGQAAVYAANVNKASSTIALTHIANNADNPLEFANGVSDLIQARVKEAQLMGGGPELIRQAEEGAKRDALKTQLQAISTKDPDRALRILEKNKNIAGTQYDELHREFRSRADVQVGNKAGEQAVLSTYTTHAPAPTVLPVLTQAAENNGISSTYLMRTWQIESGGKLNPDDSSTGAQGPFQFVGSTARQYGLTNPKDFNASANAAARFAADNKAVMERAMGRPPTDAELYLAHQQGAGGASKLLANPGVRAGDLVGDRAIRVNGGDPNAPAATFTSMWSARFNGAGVAAANMAARKTAAYDTIEADPSLNDAQRQRARAYVNQQIQAMTIAEGINEKAKKDANDTAADGYIKQIQSGNMAGIYEKITADPNLDWRTRNALGEMAQKHLGDDTRSNAQTYGPGFAQAWANLSAPIGDPARITDPVQLMQRAGPGGDLTVAGVEKLTQWMNQIKKSPDQAAVHTSMTALQNYAKSKLSFAQDVGPIKIADPKGEQIFNGEFIPKYQAAYAQWVKEGKDPWQFLTRENIDKMIVGMRSKSQMEMDRISATGEAIPGDKNAPPIPAPAGIDAKAWTAVLNTPLTTADKKPFPKADWAKALNMLIASPTPETVKAFNESKFGKMGAVDGAKILEQLGVIKPIPKRTEEPPRPAAPAPQQRNVVESLNHVIRTPNAPDSPEFEAARERTRADVQNRQIERETLAQ